MAPTGQAFHTPTPKQKLEREINAILDDMRKECVRCQQESESLAIRAIRSMDEEDLCLARISEAKHAAVEGMRTILIQRMDRVLNHLLKEIQ